MTATEILRRLLDERGVEHKDFFDQTWWEDSDGAAYIAVETRPLDNNNSSTKLMLKRTATPEQAIAATLGAGTCHDLAETPDYRDKTEFKCSECGYEYSAVGGFGCDYGDEPDFRYCPNCGRRIVDEKEDA